jgi:hypothetical protein
VRLLLVVCGASLMLLVSSCTSKPSIGAARGATSSVTPSYVPAQATVNGTQRVQDSARQSQKARWPLLHWYQLTGRANSSTSTHPATDLNIVFKAGLKSLPTGNLLLGPGAKHLFTQRRILIDGNLALLTVGKLDPTDVRVDWIDADGYHVVQCQGRETAQGRSGLTAETVIHVARSLYL